MGPPEGGRPAKGSELRSGSSASPLMVGMWVEQEGGLRCDLPLVGPM